jgi:hypothetical protein
MNTWQAYTARSAALVVLHSVPPLVVFVAAEAVTDLRDTLGQAITASFMNPAFTNRAFMNTPAVAVPAQPPASERVAVTRRMSFADYLATARAARTPDVVVTPAWVREVTGCSRGLSSRLAATLRTDTTVTVTGSGVSA